MFYEGGDILIDCNGLDLTKETPQTISGIYDKCLIAISTGKTVKACNCKWGTNDCTPIPVLLIDFGTQIIATFSTLQIVVGTNDVITITNLVGE